jgi:hypothetical protein
MKLPLQLIYANDHVKNNSVGTVPCTGLAQLVLRRSLGSFSIRLVLFDHIKATLLGTLRQTSHAQRIKG